MLWVVLGVVLAIAEAFTGTLVLVMMAAGAFAAAIAAALGAPVAAQAIVFAVVTAVSLVLLRPVIRRHALPTLSGAADTIGISALEGAPGVVLEQVTRGEGLVRVGGELWTARVLDASDVIEAGEHVRVVEVRGATVLVLRDEFGDVREIREAGG